MADSVDKVTPGPRSAAYKHALRISEGTRNLGRVQNKTTTWGRLCDKLAEPVRDNITVAQYDALSQKERHERKNMAGWFVGGQFSENRRKNANITSRSLLTYDIDECSMSLYNEIIQPFDGFLSDFEYFVYTTRSHAPEKPRIRIVIPLSRDITAAEFGPLIRIVAFHINPQMDQIDPISFKITQLMFYPNVSRDGEFIPHWNKTPKLLDPDEVLEAWPDNWRDYTRLPQSTRFNDVPHEQGRKVQDPRTKRGLIGAWCRAHTISELIEENWPDRYSPGDPTTDGTVRYSYVPGSTTNGVLVYDDIGVWSHHSSDPIAIGRLVNAWDFERINRFGDLDKGDTVEDFDNDPRKLPSFRAMEDFAQKDADTQLELQKANYDLEAMADDLVEDLEPDELEDAPPGSKVEEASTQIFEERQTEEESAEWRADLEMTKDGIIKSTVHNVVILLENDPRFKGAFAMNELKGRICLLRPIRSKAYNRDSGPIRDKMNGDPITDFHVALTRSIIEAPNGEGKFGWGLKVAETNMHHAVEIVAQRNRFHPFIAYLKALSWDGVPRLRKLLATYFHVGDTLYHEEVGRLSLLAMVTRAHEPGHKFDYMPILEGPQGIRKSTAVATLLPSPSWFGEFHMSHGAKSPKEIVEATRGRAVVELPELAAFMSQKILVESVKALFSTGTDSARLSYRRNEEDFPRQCIFWGTTNNRAYFRDETGNRRFWPIVCTRNIDVDGLARDRDQIWAEVYQEYLYLRRKYPKPKLLRLTLSPEADLVAKQLQGEKMQSSDKDAWSGLIGHWLDTPVPLSRSIPGWCRPDDFGLDHEDAPEDEPRVLRQVVCILDVKRFVLQDESKSGRNTSNDISDILSNRISGWKKDGTARTPSGVQMVWRRVAADDDPSDL
jgi:putative DNA primase/helicase